MKYDDLAFLGWLAIALVLAIETSRQTQEARYVVRGITTYGLRNTSEDILDVERLGT